jgi:hypothetical protein
MRVPARLLALLALAVVSLAAGACGNKKDEVTRGETEGIYLDLGDLKYQVQISRQLNPADAEDRAYLAGVPAADRALRPDQTWFGIFLRVQNETNSPHPSAEEFEIVDTQGTIFRPVEIGPENPFAYRPATLGPDSVLPQPDSAAAENTIQGALVLFKMPYANLENRPLEFEIHDPRDPERTAQVALDV